MALNALDRHVALVGFMGAGKTTLVAPLKARLGRGGLDLDADASSVIAERGLAAFRKLEEDYTTDWLERRTPAVYGLGGGAVMSADVRDSLRANAFTILLPVDVKTAWQRVHGSDRPLARDEGEFRRLYDERQATYREVADAVADDLDGATLAAAGVHHEPGSLERLGELVPGDGPVALVADSTVLRIHGARAGRTRSTTRLDARAAPGRGGEAAAGGRAAVVRAHARP